MQLLLVLRSVLGVGLEDDEELHGGHGHGGRRQVAQEVAAGHPAGNDQRGRTWVEYPRPCRRTEAIAAGRSRRRAGPLGSG